MRYALGIDTGGTAIKAAVVGEDGSIREKTSVPTPHGPEALIDAAAGIVRELGHDVIDTIGFDIPGIVDESTGSGVFSANLGWRDWAASKALTEATGRPVAFGHDVRTGALAESEWGLGLDNFIYVAIGTGIATVLILDGKPVAAHPWTGELGQLPTEGRVLEQVSSAAGIARAAAEQGIVADGDGAAEVYRAADQGNDAARAVIDHALDVLAGGLAPALAVVGPVPVVLGGGLVNRGEELLADLHAKLANRLGIVPAPEVLTAQLGSWAQAQGAALRALRLQ